MTDKIWEIKNKTDKDIIDALLKNRGITTAAQKKDFFYPIDPLQISLKQAGISEVEIKKALKRLQIAKKKNQKIIIYGDYDADGICSTAILWETLYKLKYNVLPYIPNRFEDGYGITPQSIDKVKVLHPDASLIITVDNGVVAHEALSYADKLGLEIIVTDHHSSDKKKPKATAVIHTTKTSGSGVAWFFAREIAKKELPEKSLELACIGTVSDQLPLIEINRSLVTHGLSHLRKTKRLGILEMLKGASIEKQNLGVYEIGFIIAPRINAMGRLSEGIEALRLICTTNIKKASELGTLINKTNLQRQKLLEEVVIHSETLAIRDTTKGVLVLAHESYHEGIIGLAASRLVEKFNRPAIVVYKGETVSKGSARSIEGINITEVLRQMEDLMISIGGHEMAAGFSINNENLPVFEKKLEVITAPLIANGKNTKKLSIDLEIGFDSIDWELEKELQKFEPTGTGNSQPLFVTNKVEVIGKKLIGSDKKHLKLKLKNKDRIFDAIGFGMGEYFEQISEKANVAYHIETNTWNGVESLQLRLRDINN